MITSIQPLGLMMMSLSQCASHHEQQALPQGRRRTPGRRVVRGRVVGVGGGAMLREAGAVIRTRGGLLAVEAAEVREAGAVPELGRPAAARVVPADAQEQRVRRLAIVAERAWRRVVHLPEAWDNNIFIV